MNLPSLKRQCILYLGILFLLLLLTGCKHLRLLQLKLQLRNIERYVQIEEQDGLTLKFTDPILEGDDVVVLMQAEPTSQTASEHVTHWHYVFQKRYVRGKEEEKEIFDFTQTMSFEDEKLKEIHISPPFSSVLNKAFIASLFQSIGRGKIDNAQEQIVMRWDQHNTREIQIPTQHAIEEAWGAPYDIEQSGAALKYLYIYTLNSGSIASDEPQLILQIWLTFRQDEEHLLSLTGWYKSLRMSIEFSQPFQGYVSMDL